MLNNCESLNTQHSSPTKKEKNAGKSEDRKTYAHWVALHTDRLNRDG